MDGAAYKDRTLVAVAGPTAVGKTAFAIAVAEAVGGEIVSCDSMQLYRYMDIGSAKPTAEERARVPHHLVDAVDPRTPFSAARYQEMAKAAIEDIFARGRVPVVAGGTGLYLNSLLYDMDFGKPKAPEDEALRRELTALAEQEGPEALHKRLADIDPEAAARIHPNNVKRVMRALESALAGMPIAGFTNASEKCKDYQTILIGLTRNRDELYDRINRRVEDLVAAGLFEEVRGLMDMGLGAGDISMQGIGYKESIGYLSGDYDRETAIRMIQTNTRHYAKRQLTWFRRYEEMTWFMLSDYPSDRAAKEDIIAWLNKRL